ncbi:MAG: hypothetical protein ACOH1N_07525 [Lutibacter sp.]
MNKLSKSYVILFIFIIITISYLTYWGIKHIPSQDELCKQGVEFYKTKNFTGVVIKKYIDEENHSHKTIIVKENMNEKSIFLDADIGGIYEYISIGDSISKNKGELFVLINRKKNDTIIDFKFRCY